MATSFSGHFFFKSYLYPIISKGFIHEVVQKSREEGSSASDSFQELSSDTNRTTDRLKSKTNQGSHDKTINWMLL